MANFRKSTKLRVHKENEAIKIIHNFSDTDLNKFIGQKIINEIQQKLKL